MDSYMSRVLSAKLDL